MSVGQAVGPFAGFALTSLIGFEWCVVRSPDYHRCVTFLLGALQVRGCAGGVAGGSGAADAARPQPII